MQNGAGYEVLNGNENHNIVSQIMFFCLKFLAYTTALLIESKKNPWDENWRQQYTFSTQKQVSTTPSLWTLGPEDSPAGGG